MFVIKSGTKSNVQYKILIVFSLIGIVFAAILGRGISVEKFGVLNILLAIMLIFSALGAPIHLITARYISSYKESDEQYKIGQFLRKSLFYVLISVIILIALSLIFAPLISEYFKIGNVYYVGIIASTAFLTLPLAVFTGLSRGVKRHWELGFLYIIIPVVTLISGSIMVFCGLRFYSLLFGILTGVFTADVVGLIISKYDLELNGPQNIELGRKEVLDRGIPILIVSVGMVFLANIDLLVIKHYFSPYEVGIYSAGAVLVKLIFCTLFTIMIAGNPILAEAKGMDDESYTSIKKALLWGIIYGIAGTVIASFFAKPLISLIFGYRYTSAASYVWLVNIYSMILFLLGVLAVSAIALRRTRVLAWTLILAILADACLIISVHTNFGEILFILIGTGLGLLMVNVTDTILKKPSKALKIV